MDINEFLLGLRVRLKHIELQLQLKVFLSFTMLRPMFSQADMPSLTFQKMLSIKEIIVMFYVLAWF